MTFLITKADLGDYTRVSANVADLLINPAIRDAHTFDVLPLLAGSEAQLLAAYLTDAGRPAFAVSYAAAEALGFPEAELAALQASPLYQRHVLYVSAVRPLLCYETYRRFLLDHGAHVTENGVETFSSGNNQPISQAQRTEMRADAAAKCSHYRALLTGALHTYRGPAAAATACGAGPNRRPGAGGLRTVAL
ncbi:DUF6712 family protein [Hymenobacter cheonanensis]|uniref:DUF6712 family protein n=1 Tax=Hymenobacter sp. CA2-7 TaxID=3063993 RepID=UPI0027130264|nr:hypothetical protein [Hymenobacter sp. CA2-7]MDO7888202.1 hypothetical protein [Hymenobacter sp. CA2-7]